MRSIESVARLAKSKAPVAGALSRTPSSSTRVWDELPPRTKTLVIWPGPPPRTTSTPGTVRSSSATEALRLSSISSAVITVTELPTRRRPASRRLAVTTISSRISGRDSSDVSSSGAVAAS